MGLGLLIEGQWVSKREQSDRQGQFIRPETSFRQQITADGSSGFPAESGRYHLYISWACPWAHRTAILRKLKGLESVIGLSVVDPEIDGNGWEFSAASGCIPDTVNEVDYLWQLYAKADSSYSGRVTVPVLWDKQTQTIVNNESREIIRMLDTEFENFTERQITFIPPELAELIDSTIDTIYQPINNGVYRAGFATTQEAYDRGVTELFAALDHWDEVLEQQSYLCGDRITEADWCLFTTLLRFDLVYYGHFKCNLRHITDYPNLWNYLKELYQVPGIAETCNFDHIKRHYYRSHPQVNPTRIVPKGPHLDFGAPYERNLLIDKF
ncbi:glutathione S-transferase family protein [Roseofilum casamattae]|uniref:Glutathione S-transferase family protein n=1 Tax=Roseofilum casamattae BLCC-M143 TaxID=3022442 RepID=A0ABT7C2W7_9CYAN|nr:glutathione S-transferase family protein [Roseofilum casamattae]MDJ1185808.1 glutathione S-transferase family protein [Roseofilum casamattae BLCC-M143]